ncbi:hypothetical protein QBC37DRAFT_433484 [Rhypophila decipiens]|uniref:Xylanolytic transcriptional activator regulatory domain-containing protein n=1 Tax=Rhypophila decipiens TaxID=261697 RepID=A0AAN6XXB6_9PEZI|nr:hypothetical protein QBC37DRAFT_433484 [Rhypophila decipiens]
MFPECNRCSRLGYKCTYRDRVSHRASQAVVIQQLQDRMSQAEARLAQQGIALTPGASSPTFHHQTIAASGLPLQPPSSATSSVAGSIPRASLQYQHSQSRAEMSYSTTTPISMGLGRPAAGFDRVRVSTHQDAPSLIGFDFSTLETADFAHDNPTHTEQGYGLAGSLGLDMESPALDWSHIQRQAAQEPTSPYHFRSVSLVSTDERVHNITPEDLGALHQVFFDNFATAMPILYQDRFYRELRDSPNELAVNSVSYTISLLAILISEQYRHLEPTCYTLARRYIDACETETESNTLNSIRFLQSILFLTRYELGRRNYTRASMLMGRALRLGKILRLDELDKDHGNETVLVSTGIVGTLHGKLAPAQDVAEMEERRRCMWALYVLDGSSAIFTGSLGPLDDEEMFVSLPSPGILDSKFTPIRMPTLPQVTSTVTNPEELIAPFTGLVLVASLLRRVFHHARSSDSLHPSSTAASGSQDPPPILTKKYRPGPGFWDRHYSLIRECKKYGRLLHHFSSPGVLYNDPVAFNIHLTFCATALRLWDAALDEAERSGLSSTLDSTIQIQMLAVKIANTIRSTWTTQRMARDNISLSGAFVAWPLCMAIKGLNRRPAQDDELEQEHELQNAASSGKGRGKRIDSQPAQPPDNMDRVALLQVLCAALDEVETPGGPWHESIAGLVNMGLLHVQGDQRQHL